MHHLSVVFVAAGAALLIFGNALAWPRAIEFAAALIVLVAALVLIEGAIGYGTYPRNVLMWVLVALVFTVTPILIVVGWDFAEIALDTTAALFKRDPAALDSSILAPTLLVAALVALALWLGAGLAHTGLVTLSLRALGLLLLCGAFIWYAARRGVET